VAKGTFDLAFDGYDLGAHQTPAQLAVVGVFTWLVAIGQDFGVVAEGLISGIPANAQE